MTQPQRVLYLPPGVVPPPSSSPQIPQQVATGIPFDRVFFEQVLPPSIAGFCKQVKCKVPVVELLTVDGVTHYVSAINGVADAWVALQTADLDHDHPTQVFIPYQTIFRVEIHPEEDGKREKLGFLTARE